ncbi:TrkA family potassium uptake protein [Cryobacterium zongtaii]|uniref:TrkA family potassium uptake protein n=1 Tax=Cryobacterium zongtaii TaxID=1259217 RepID=A0A2S3Z4W7_9MICO|nr:potassium transporter [Cryobacterium sp. LW097]POH57971.1 TrkA family potassium uptake protein [Cryobacterium zongtaii]TFC58712.1 TrkA family potassium uptake protein [Cryobacterium sp. TMB3-1-2]TFC67377.1 TrkA family potassium uptake protein [Cryobacterium sp. TMB3-15]TFC73472.1 TrkA family potassium uptake protein [Cryobacterium sp. TMB3-10]TFD44172.1 TrkA family potassium uptake protein [Cryobacterium sp. TMB3-12]
MAEEDSVVVIGLGRFGSALALELMDSGTEVLGIDGDEEIVQAHNRLLTHVVRADSTKEETLRQLSVPEFSSVVVAIGSDIQANILTASLLIKMGIPNIWAKAVSEPHGEILRQLGVKHVISPEKDMGKRVAHLVRGVMQDYIDIGEDFALVKTAPPQEILGKPLSETRVRTVHGITVTAFHRAGQGWSYATMETVILAGDIILVAGQTERVESFSRLP